MGQLSKDKTQTLYRPVGVAEAVLILEADARRFPPRLPEQPIFYPVMTREYAEQIAQRWNTRDAASGYAGFVTKFQLDAKYAARFEPHVVGIAAVHRELWVPAEELEEFNQHIIGPIALVSAHYGDGYAGPIPRTTMLKGRTAHEQLPLLERILEYNAMDFTLEVRVQRAAVQLNFAYWVRTDFTADGLPSARKVAILQNTRIAWNEGYPETQLIGSDELEALSSEIQS